MASKAKVWKSSNKVSSVYYLTLDNKSIPIVHSIMVPHFEALLNTFFIILTVKNIIVQNYIGHESIFVH